MEENFHTYGKNLLQILLKTLQCNYRSHLKQSILASYQYQRRLVSDLFCDHSLHDLACIDRIPIPLFFFSPEGIGFFYESIFHLTIGDVMNVLENLLEELPRGLIDGKTVSLGDFGNFRLNLSSEGVADKNKFNPKTFKPKGIFTPWTQLKQALGEIHYQEE